MLKKREVLIELVVLQSAKNQDGSIRYFITISKYYIIRKKWKKGTGIDFKFNSRNNFILVEGGTVILQEAKNSNGTKRYFITLPKHLVESKLWKCGYKIGFAFDEDMQIEIIVEESSK